MNNRTHIINLAKNYFDYPTIEQKNISRWFQQHASAQEQYLFLMNVNKKPQFKKYIIDGKLVVLQKIGSICNMAVGNVFNN